MNSTWQIVSSVEPDVALMALLKELEDKPVSQLARHTASCCAIAEAWFRATARAATQRFGYEPCWISERWNWGPTIWPIAWCEAIRADVLDCGALAALAEVAFEEAGREVVRVQLIEEASAEEREQWAAEWAVPSGAPTWIWGRLVYHEAVGVLDGERMAVWNPNEGTWYEDSSSRARAARFIHSAGRITRSTV